jgi:hypothetical protein
MYCQIRNIIAKELTSWHPSESPKSSTEVYKTRIDIPLEFRRKVLMYRGARYPGFARTYSEGVSVGNNRAVSPFSLSIPTDLT